MIAWFARNGVAANLLMGIILVGGFFTLTGIKMELFPQFSLDIITVRVPFPGASPEETEEQICKRIEERIQDLEGIKKIVSTAAEGYGQVLVEVERGHDPRLLLDNIKVRVDAIDTFPDQAEKPIIEEVLIKREVITVAVGGPVDEETLKRLGERVRDDLTAIPGISQVEIKGVRNYEVAVEVDEEALRRYGLSFSAVARAVRESSLDLPGGSIKSGGGEILLRTTGQAYRREDFEAITLISRSDGTRVRLGEVATVVDGFVDDELETRYQGQPAVLLQVYEVGTQSPLDIANKVYAYVESMQGELPPGIEINAIRDLSYYLKGRLTMLIHNGIIGLILVFMVLSLFLRPSLAFFVMIGIPISFLGTFFIMPSLDTSINLVSLFGFILVLGIVVDDAIVVGESVFTQYQKHGPGVESAIAGAHEVAMPVTFAVLTTVVAFIPVLLLPGFLGKIFQPIPMVVIPTLLWSLVQSKLILPYHLSLCRVGEGHRDRLNWFSRRQRAVADGLERFIDKVYRPLLAHALRWRYVTLAIFVCFMLVTVGLLGGRWIKFSFFPEVPSDYIVAKLVMPEGTHIDVTRRALRQMEDGMAAVVAAIEAEGGVNPFQDVVITLGSAPFSGEGGPMGGPQGESDSHFAEIAIELFKSEERELSAPDLANRWRDAIGVIPGARELSFQARAAGGAGMPIDIQLSGRDFEQMQRASEAIKAALASYTGVYDITDNYSGGKREMQIKIKPEGEMLGLTQRDLAEQVRQAFYGEEAQRIQRDRDDIRVMVRYPPDSRRSPGDLENLRIRTPDGVEIPFSEVADAVLGQGYPTIKRVDRRRVINVTADIDKSAIDPEILLQDIGRVMMPELLADFPGVSWDFEGERREQAEAFTSIKSSVIIVLFLIYALMAVPFKSYLQPLIIMVVIPFGLVGAIWGHWLFGFRDVLFGGGFNPQPISSLSILGMAALAGVVVNDSLVLVDWINRQRRRGVPLFKAVYESGAARFRPILLTSLTTFAGLVPILLERTLQAQFLIPMAISLSFGVIFATVITLFMVPASYLILEDVLRSLRRLWYVLR